MRRPQAALAVPPMRREQKLPEILSRQEVERILAAPRTLRERLLLMAAYGSGLRVSEVVALRPADLDVERGVIRVEQGKGKKDRQEHFGDHSDAQRFSSTGPFRHPAKTLRACRPRRAAAWRKNP